MVRALRANFDLGQRPRVGNTSRGTRGGRALAVRPQGTISPADRLAPPVDSGSDRVFGQDLGEFLYNYSPEVGAFGELLNSQQFQDYQAQVNPPPDALLAQQSRELLDSGARRAEAQFNQDRTTRAGLFGDAFTNLDTARTETEANYQQFNEQLSGTYNRNLASLLAGIPENPFTDDIFEGLRDEQFGLIDAERAASLSTVSQDIYSRGFGTGGSQGSTAATNVDLAASQGRSSVTGQLRAGQAQVNQAAAQYRAGVRQSSNQFFSGLQAQVNSEQQGALNRFNEQEAAIRAAQAAGFDPTFLPQFTGQITSAQVGINQAEALNSISRQAISAGQPGFLQSLLDVGGRGLLGAGFEKWGSIAQGLGQYI